MQHVFHSPQEYSFEKNGHKGKIFDTKSLSDKVQITLIEVEDEHAAKIIGNECTFSYFILEGAGSFEIDDVVEDCAPGDLVVIPNGAVFKYEGKMKMLLVINPWWSPEQEETL